MQLKREPANHRDKHDVAVVKADGEIVGHLPYNLAPIVSPFLARDFNKGTAEITGNRVNRGAGYGIEAPCISRLYGPKKFIQRVEELVVKLRSKGPKPFCHLSHKTNAKTTLGQYMYMH